MRSLRLFTLAILLVLMTGAVCQAQQNSEMPAGTLTMQDYIKMMAPGEKHEVLAYFIGDWTLNVKMFMGGPGTEAAEYPGTATYSWTMGKRFVRQVINGEFMGQPYNSEGFMGYDNFQKHYVSVGIDNISTAVSTLSGVYDKQNKAFVMYGAMDEPMTGEVAKTVKYVMRIKDQNHFVGEMHDPIYGLGDTKVMEIHYTRN